MRHLLHSIPACSYSLSQRFWLSLFIAYVTCVPVFAGVPPQEPRSRIDHLIQQLGAPEFEVREQAMKQLIASEDASLSRLRKALENSDPEIVRRARLCIEAIENKRKVASYISDLGNPDPKTRATAAENLMKMGETAQAAVPALIKLLDDEDTHVRTRAADALGQIGPAARAGIPRLQQLLRDTRADPMLQWSAAITLANIGKDAECTVPDLLQLLKADAPLARNGAANALGVLGKSHPDVIPALIAALDDPRDIVQRAAAEALGLIGKEPERCVPSLMQAFKKAKGYRGSSDPRSGILTALGRFAVINKEAIRESIGALYELARDDTEATDGLRSRAVYVLGRMGPEVRDKLEMLATKKGTLVSYAARKILKEFDAR